MLHVNAESKTKNKENVIQNLETKPFYRKRVLNPICISFAHQLILLIHK